MENGTEVSKDRIVGRSIFAIAFRDSLPRDYRDVSARVNPRAHRAYLSL